MSKQKESATAVAENQPQTALAATQPAAVAVSEEKSLLALFEEDAGLGVKNLGAADIAIPYLTILQKNSPQVDMASPKLIVGAQQGQLYNTVTNEVYDGKVGVRYVFCAYSLSCVEWKTRESGGGLVKHHNPNDPILKTFKQDPRGRLVTPEGNIIVDTAYHFGLQLHEEAPPEAVVISMYSTQLKKSRNLNTMLQRRMVMGSGGKMFTPPRYATIYRITTKPESKDQFNWFGYVITAEEDVADVGLAKYASRFAHDAESGKVKVGPPPTEDLDADNSDEVPF